jgi:hypothetical protein
VPECIELLQQTVPSDYIRQTRNTYKKTVVDASLHILATNDIVEVSSIGQTFPTTNLAYNWISIFYNYFEDNNWRYYRTIRVGDVYVKNNVFAIIEVPSRRSDRLIMSMVWFTFDLKFFGEI